MDKQIFFNASLPRAGSTLLQNIIGQNPQFHVTSTSGVTDLIVGSFNNFYSADAFRNQKDYNLCKESFYNFCRGGLNGYYSNVKQNFILEKNRTWWNNHLFLKKIYKQPKIIVLVRDLRAIYSSFEKLYLKDPFSLFKLQENNNDPNILNTFNRIQNYELLFPTQYFLPLLQNLIETQNKDKIFLARFEDLCINPQQTLDKIYSYLEIPTFKHDFNKIDQITYENDNFRSLSNHDIKPKLTLPNRDWDEVLTPKGSDYIYEKYKWYFEYFNYQK